MKTKQRLTKQSALEAVTECQNDLAYLSHLASNGCCIANDFREEYGPNMAEQLRALREFIEQCADPIEGTSSKSSITS